jgi:hypothetical protein
LDDNNKKNAHFWASRKNISARFEPTSSGL